jgi:hypothetical protein
MKNNEFGFGGLSITKIVKPKFIMKVTTATLGAFEGLPREGLLAIAGHLTINNIRNLSLALLQRDTLCLLNDQYLFRQLAQRDFSYDLKLAVKVSRDWSWKDIYRALVGIRRQMLCEMEIRKGLRFPCHGNHLLIPPVPLRVHIVRASDDSDDDDEEDDHHHHNHPMLETIQSMCVTVDEDRDLKFRPDDADVVMATRDFVNLEMQENLHGRSVMKRFFPDYPGDIRPPKQQQISLVQEGLCLWMHHDKIKHCRYKLFYPMDKLRSLYNHCKLEIERKVAERQLEVDRILAQKFILKYRLDKPQLVMQNAEQLWRRLKRLFGKAELDIEKMEFLENGYVLAFTVSRKVEWLYDRLCLGEGCVETISKQTMNEAHPAGNLMQARRRFLCHFHLMMVNASLQELTSERTQYLIIERLNFVNRDFVDAEHHLNLELEFSVAVTKNARLNFKRLHVDIL